MNDSLRYNIEDFRIAYNGRLQTENLDQQQIDVFNSRHEKVLDFYGLKLSEGAIFIIEDNVNKKSNLGVFRSKQLRQAVVLAAALPAAGVAMDGYAALKNVPKTHQTKELINQFKRNNDRTSAQIMSEVLQITTETLEVGEEVLIESVSTEGVRVKPGLEPGGNPTIPIGALFGKEMHCSRYGRDLGRHISLLSMGSDVVEGTSKSVKGLHSSLTTLFITESGFKRHLPDIYVQRWMAGKTFDEFNPRHTDIEEEVRIISKACGMEDYSKMSAFFLDRARHHPAMDKLNSMGVATAYDKDGDLFPALVLGLEGLEFPNGKCLTSMIGEIGGSAEWIVGALPLVWRGGQSLGMLTSQSSLTRKDLSPEELWGQRFNYTEEELILFHDARFEQKPFFTVDDIMERPFAGGISAFSAISDNYYLPPLEGVRIDREKEKISTNTLMINSLGNIEIWHLEFKCKESMEDAGKRLKTPKSVLKPENGDIYDIISRMADNETERLRLKHFFLNEYYPAILQTDGKMVILEKTIENMINRQVFDENDRYIVRAVLHAAPEWFVSMG